MSEPSPIHPTEASQDNATGRRAGRPASRRLSTMELLAIVALFMGLALLAALPLVVLLRSAEALAGRRGHLD